MAKLKINKASSNNISIIVCEKMQSLDFFCFFKNIYFYYFMYWRVNCTGHLTLDLELGRSSASAAGINDNRRQRPRSTTYSGKDQLQRQIQPQQASILKWATSPDQRLLVGVSSHSVYLWSIRPFVLLSALVYGPVEELGSFVDILWETDSNGGYSVYVMTTTGFVYDISVYNRNKPVLEYQFVGQHYYARGPGEGKGVVPWGLGQKRTYKLPATIQGQQCNTTVLCATTARSGEKTISVIATRSHIYRIVATGEVVSSTSIRQEINDNPLAHMSQMLHIAGKEGGSMELYLFNDGFLYTRSHYKKRDQFVEAIDKTTSFTTLAYNPICQIVAVGTTCGHVLLYKLAIAKGDNSGNGGLNLERIASKVSFAHREETKISSVRVTSIEWTPDGCAMACGYSSGHVVIYSTLGYELNATRLVSQHLPGLTTPTPLFLTWMPGACQLLISSDCISSGNGDSKELAKTKTLNGQQVNILPFVRAALSSLPGSAAAGNSKHVCLYSDDKVFLYRCDILDHSQQPELQWQVAQVPPDYISANWPMRYVAVNDDGHYMAVAGQRGLATYNLRTHKWRMFRSQQQEMSISCVGGLLWYGQYLAVACINYECDEGEPLILFFPRGKSLDTANATQTVVLESPVVCMSCHNSILLVLCQDNVLYQYSIFDDKDFIQVSFRRSTDMGVYGVDPLRVRSVQWVPSALFDGCPAYLVHEGTTLRVIEEANDSNFWLVVSDEAEFTITSGVNFGDMHSIVWWFNGTKLYASLISLEDFMEGGVRPLLVSSRQGPAPRMMCIRPEFYPVAISADKGMAVGIDQDWIMEEHAIIGLSKLPIRAKLYLHNILDHMLSEGAEQDALMYAACFESLDFFSHAMEILLHEVLERETASDNTNKPAAAVLPRVISLLENFTAFYDIVVHCARKTEAAFWSHLFACVGGPSRFFQQCLQKNLLETATQCLIILQTLEPSSVSEDNIMALLDKIVETENTALCVEILRFVKMTSESDLAMKGLLEKLRNK